MNLKLLISAALLLVVASVANAQKVAVGYNKIADFSKYRTYSWTTGVPAKNPEIDRVVVDAIDRQLQAKGLQRVTEAGDMLVSYHAAVATTFDQATVARPGTWGPRAGSMDQVWQVVRGSLIVAMQDGKSKEELWRATATDTLSNEPNVDFTKDMNQTTKKINKVVDKIFSYYPPTKSK